MRKFLIPMIAAGTALGFSAPAAAQAWAPPAYNYQPYNFGMGFNGGNFARSMQSRVQRVRGDIRMMQDRRVLSWNQARSLDRQAEMLQRRIFIASTNGIQPWEARNLENGIRNLEMRVARQANRWNRPGYGYRRY